MTKKYSMIHLPRAEEILEISPDNWPQVPVEPTEYLVGILEPHSYVYYKRFGRNKYYKMPPNELAFLKLKGEEIPF